jgi:hypothetical protein
VPQLDEKPDGLGTKGTPNETLALEAGPSPLGLAGIRLAANLRLLCLYISYQTRQRFSLTIGWPALQMKAF